ncbi:unnamed protein product, partial [Musa textilis]
TSEAKGYHPLRETKGCCLLGGISPLSSAHRAPIPFLYQLSFSPWASPSLLCFCVLCLPRVGSLTFPFGG